MADDSEEGKRHVDVEKVRKHFDDMAAVERQRARARGVPLVAAIYAVSLLTVAAVVGWLAVRYG